MLYDAVALLHLARHLRTSWQRARVPFHFRQWTLETSEHAAMVHGQAFFPRMAHVGNRLPTDAHVFRRAARLPCYFRASAVAAFGTQKQARARLR